MYDQLIIGNRASEDDFRASVKTRKVKDPEKKKITKTVPFSNVTYDFTKLNGEIYWNQRELEYELEMIAPSPEVLEEMKIDFSNFVMNVIDEDIFDPWLRDYHFNGTFESISYEDDESGNKTTVTVKFLAYPYKIANFERKYTEKIEPESSATARIYNDSSHKITPTIFVVGSVRIVFGNISVALGRGVHKNVFTLEPGLNELYMENLEKTNDTDLPEIERIAIELGYSTVEITFVEEVF